MTPLDDELTTLLARAMRPVETDGVLPRVAARRRRIRTRRTLATVGMALGLLAVGTLAYAGLPGLRPRPSTPAPTLPSGVIVYQRLLEDCDVSGIQGLDAFATSIDGETTWRLGPFAGAGVDRAIFVAGPVLSPDGTRLAFTDHYEGGLWVAEIGARRATRLSGGNVVADTIAWTPDGAAIVFQVAPFVTIPAPEDDGPGPGIFRVAASGGPATMLGSGAMPVLSPDGATIAFVRDGALWFMDADGSNVRRIARRPRDARFGLDSADWSPDGRRFAVSASVAGNVDLYVVDLAERTGVRLTDDPAQDVDPDWSPDGRWIAFSTGRWGEGTGHAEIALIPAEGGDVVRLTDDCWDDFAPDWSSSVDAVGALPPWDG